MENCHKTGHRSMFVIVGDKGRDQVVNLHYMLSKTVVKARPSVLWCYKKDLYLSRCTFHQRQHVPEYIEQSCPPQLPIPSQGDLACSSCSLKYKLCLHAMRNMMGVAAALRVPLQVQSPQEAHAPDQEDDAEGAAGP